MVKKMYAVKDLKVGVFNYPFPQTTHGEAERTFSQTVNNPDTMPYQHPEDFVLYHMGEFDDVSGQFTSLKVPAEIITAVQLKKPNQKVQNLN